ncbi:hypothetical protein LTR35_017508 [Friedmanniomyces endolithicus]|nr:hypothetical protein LTR35_017508 [Friedmanniomyces endolithicus]
MYRMNKPQELHRNFRFLSIFGYSLILGNGWVIALVGAIIPLTNGGTAGGIWMYLIVIIGMTFSTLSMAELASMAPTAGGQYHWVSEFAPRKHQQFLSYMTAGYAVPSWQGVVLTIGIVLSTIFFNTVVLRTLPMFEGMMLVIHVFGFLPVCVIMWVMGDRSPTKEVWTHFSDYSGWGSYGVATLIGSLGVSGSLLGSDSAAHLAEELKDAA